MKNFVHSSTDECKYSDVKRVQSLYQYLSPTHSSSV